MVDTPHSGGFGEVQSLSSLAASLIDKKELVLQELIGMLDKDITQLPSSIDNVFVRVHQVNSIQVTERLWDRHGCHRSWLSFTRM